VGRVFYKGYSCLEKPVSARYILKEKISESYSVKVCVFQELALMPWKQLWQFEFGLQIAGIDKNTRMKFAQNY
jgi:ABC-type taurine transport system ATPase subunit